MKLKIKITAFTMAIYAALLPASAKTQGQDLSLSSLTSVAASPWVENTHVRSRLLSSHINIAQDPQVQHYLGWEVQLKTKGWKTYWRTPGEAGIPPSFNWEGSQNLGRTDVFYPLPERFQIFDIQTFGYGERVIIPIRVEPQIGGTAMNLKLEVSFMACKEICIPFVANYQLNLPAADGMAGAEHIESVFAKDINRFMQAVPLTNEVNNGTLVASNLALSGVVGQQLLSMKLSGSKHLAGGDIYIETLPHFKFGTPQRQLLGKGDQLLVTFPVHSINQLASLSGEEIKLTLSDGWGYSIEQLVTVP